MNLIILTTPLPVLAPSSMHTDLSLPNLSKFYFYFLLGGEPMQGVKGVVRREFPWTGRKAALEGLISLGMIIFYLACSMHWL